MKAWSSAWPLGCCRRHYVSPASFYRRQPDARTHSRQRRRRFWSYRRPHAALHKRRAARSFRATRSIYKGAKTSDQTCAVECMVSGVASGTCVARIVAICERTQSLWVNLLSLGIINYVSYLLKRLPFLHYITDLKLVNLDVLVSHYVFFKIDRK